MSNKQPKISTKDWRNLPTERWNTTTFRQYLADKHAELYGIPYVTNNYAAEAGMIKRMIDEYGAEATKAMIDIAFAEYKPTRIYPGLNYAFIYSFMRSRILPRVLAEQKRAEAKASEEVAQEQADEVSAEWW